MSSWSRSSPTTYQLSLVRLVPNHNHIPNLTLTIIVPLFQTLPRPYNLLCLLTLLLTWIGRYEDGYGWHHLVNDNISEILKVDNITGRGMTARLGGLDMWRDETKSISEHWGWYPLGENKDEGQSRGVPTEHDSYRRDRRWSPWQNWPNENCLCRSEPTTTLEGRKKKNEQGLTMCVENSSGECENSENYNTCGEDIGEQVHSEHSGEDYGNGSWRGIQSAYMFHSAEAEENGEWRLCYACLMKTVSAHDGIE